jgi:hypothetical protein
MSTRSPRSTTGTSRWCDRATSGLLRQVQCREGWHLTKEPDFTPEPPTEDQTELLTLRANLVEAYGHAVSEGAEVDVEELRGDIGSVDSELRELGMRGRLPSIDLPTKKPAKRSTKRRQDAPNLPRRKVSKTTVGASMRGSSGPRCSSP